MKCGTATCTTDAAYRVLWPGKAIVMCRPCALRASRVSDAMGFDLTVDPLDPDGPPLSVASLVDGDDS